MCVWFVYLVALCYAFWTPLTVHDLPAPALRMVGSSPYVGTIQTWRDAHPSPFYRCFHISSNHAFWPRCLACTEGGGGLFTGADTACSISPLLTVLMTALYDCDRLTHAHRLYTFVFTAAHYCQHAPAPPARVLATSWRARGQAAGGLGNRWLDISAACAISQSTYLAIHTHTAFRARSKIPGSMHTACAAFFLCNGAARGASGLLLSWRSRWLCLLLFCLDTVISLSPRAADQRSACASSLRASPARSGLSFAHTASLLRGGAQHEYRRGRDTEQHGVAGHCTPREPTPFRGISQGHISVHRTDCRFRWTICVGLSLYLYLSQGILAISITGGIAMLCACSYLVL